MYYKFLYYKFSYDNFFLKIKEKIIFLETNEILFN